MDYNDFDKSYPIKITTIKIPERPDSVEWRKGTGHWLVQLKIDSDHHICFLYSMGSGNKEQRSTGPNPPFTRGTIAHEENAYWPKLTVAQVLDSLMMDALTAEDHPSLDHYLGEFHANETYTWQEFRKARRTYEACQDNKDKLIKLLGIKGYELLITVERL